MGTKITVEYDEVGDILYLDVAPPTEDQVMLEVAPGTLLRKNTRTGVIEGVEILGFRRRSVPNEGLEVPVVVDLKLPGPVSG